MTEIPSGDLTKYDSGAPLWERVGATSQAFFVDIRCPNGHICGLGGPSGHVIDAAGNVSPSVVCPRPGCGFHDHVRLLGWTA